MRTLDVLIPEFNDASGLVRSLESVRKQTWRGDVRVVVCDDGSKPDALKEIERIVDGYSGNIVLLKNGQNRGRPYTRNVLLDSTEGIYVAWLDAGDEWYRDKIEDQFDAIYRSAYKFGDKPVWVTCNYDWAWIGARKRARKQDVKGDQVKSLLLGPLGAYLWTLLGKAEAFRDVGYFDTALTRLQDLDFFLRFIVKGGTIILPPKHDPLCVYNKTDVGRNAREIRQCFKYIYNKHRVLYMRYSPRFRRNRRYDIELLAARLAKHNSDFGRMGLYLARAFGQNSGRFIQSVARGRLGI